MIFHTSINYDPTGRKRKKRTPKGEVYKKFNPVFKPMSVKSAPYRKEIPEYPSHDIGMGMTPRKDNQQYTGTFIKGIATMHKSNAVPVINDIQAKEIARMRR